MADLNQYMNKAFDYEEKGYVEEAIHLCSKCIQAFPEYKREIELEIAKINYRNGKERKALLQFLMLLDDTGDETISNLIIEAYYGAREQEFQERYRENYKLLEEYSYFYGELHPLELRYYPIWTGENEIWYYDSAERIFQVIERYGFIMGELEDTIYLGSDLLWMEDLLILEKKTRMKEPFMDMENPLLLLYQKSHWELLCQTIDLKELMKFDRIIFHDDISRLERSLLTDGICFPVMVIGNRADTILQELGRLNNKMRQEYENYQTIIKEYYLQNRDTVVKNIKNGNPRILFITSRFTTALQYHVRDCKIAAERMGLETELQIEKDRLCTGQHNLSIFRQIAKFRPDLIFSIDHFRHEREWKDCLEGIVWVCWAQDAMPEIYSKETPAKLTDRDFLMTHYITSKKFKDIGYDAKCVIDAPIPANPYVYQPYQLNDVEKKKYSCDICFVCHSSNVESYIDEVAEKFPEQLQEKICAIYRGYYDYVCETGELFYTEQEFELFIKGAFSYHYNMALTAEALDYFVEDMWRYFNDRVYRQMLVQWMLDAGFTNIKLWGNGWAMEEKYKEYAMGPAQNGETLSKIYQASKIVIGNNIMTTAAARAWETMLSGGFYMSNYIPEENDDVDIRKILEVDKDVIMFYNREDLIQKLHYYLEHEEERQKMIERGRKAALEKMTYDILMKRVLKEIGERLEEN